MKEDTYDFGFSITMEDDISHTHVGKLEEQIKDLKERLHTLNKLFIPLLDNLSKNPDKAMIKWPNRKEILDKQKERLMELTNV